MVKKIKLLYANKLYKKLSGSICSKYPLKNVVKITPDIYNVDIGGYLFSYYKNNFFYSSFFRYLLARF